MVPLATRNNVSLSVYFCCCSKFSIEKNQILQSISVNIRYIFAYNSKLLQVTDRISTGVNDPYNPSHEAGGRRCRLSHPRIGSLFTSLEELLISFSSGGANKTLSTTPCLPPPFSLTERLAKEVIQVLCKSISEEVFRRFLQV